MPAPAAASAPPILIHLTGDLATLVTIAGERTLRGVNPVGAVHRHRELAPSQVAVSLSEIDLAEMGRLAARHGEFGVAFGRRWVQQQGGAPVWYLPRSSPVQQRLFEEIRKLAFTGNPVLDHFLWTFTPFIDYPKDPDAGGTPYDWRWEREWRVVGDLHFLSEDIVALFAPQTSHAAVRQAWRLSATPGASVPPVVDVNWAVAEQIAAIRSAPAADPVAEPSPPLQATLREPPDDPMFEDLPWSPSPPRDPVSAWYDDEEDADYVYELDCDMDLVLLDDIEADPDFDLERLHWLDDEGEGLMSHEAEKDEGEEFTSDDEQARVEQRDEWELWLNTFERDDI